MTFSKPGKAGQGASSEWEKMSTLSETLSERLSDKGVGLPEFTPGPCVPFMLLSRLIVHNL